MLVRQPFYTCVSGTYKEMQWNHLVLAASKAASSQGGDDSKNISLEVAPEATIKFVFLMAVSFAQLLGQVVAEVPSENYTFLLDQIAPSHATEMSVVSRI